MPDASNGNDGNQVSATQASAKMKSSSTMRGGGTTSTGALNITRETSSNNRLGASASMRPNSVIAHGFNNSLSTKRSLGTGSKNYRAGDDENLNLLQKQVRSLQLEKEKMRELIEELK